MNEFDRTPPHDLDAERCALGGMLLNKDVLSEVSTILAEADFYDSRHGDIYRMVTGMDATGQPVDVLSVTAKLMDSGDLKRMPSATYISDVAASVPTAANAPWYAHRVADMAARRRLIEAGTRIVAMGYAPGLDSAEVTDRAQRDLHQATAGRSPGTITTMDALMRGVMAAIDTAGEREAGLRGVSTGLIELDALTGGWRPGQLIIVAGRPGMGKSVYTVDAARTVAFRYRRPAMIFSLEMAVSEIGDRIMAAESGVDLDLIQSGELTDTELSKVAIAAGKIGDAPLFIDDSADLTLSTIRSRARRVQQQHGLDLVCVDYLQLLNSASKTENRQQEVSEISRGLKLLAKELGCPVIAAAQLNRNVESRMDKRPMLADLRESGSVENDADLVLMLHRPAYYKVDHRPGEVDVIVAKNRHGATDTIVASAQLHLSRFVDHHPDAPN